ncbi:MAG: hypothetical protein OEX77_08240 [Candidatus Bathyarchaeota archaeon]|nr:hypothetical protein [Candidatus Bathyarchaeota archaeon]MDH5733199.1 hypothetical protein [Candidatus Bathyarchaeota archaeon]
MSKLLKVMAIALLFLVAYSQVPASIQVIPTYTLELEQDGKGTIAVVPRQTKFEENASVMLSATPADGWIFVGWTGRVGLKLWESQEPEVTIKMTGDAKAKAIFLEVEVAKYTLELEQDGKGTIAVVPHQRKFEENAFVALSATPADGWIFVGWTGRVGLKLWESQEPEVTIKMTGDAKAKAIFSPN